VENIILVGTVCNVSRTIKSELRILLEAFSDFRIHTVYLVESDSTDNTREVIGALTGSVPQIHLEELGDLKSALPDRISRIRFCRNRYVDFLRHSIEVNKVDYVVVVDLDGMNSNLTQLAVRSCFIRSDWDVVLSNQTGGYYDLLALRHPEWCPGDIMSDLRSEQMLIDHSRLPRYAIVARLRRRLAFDRAREKIIYSKMKVVPTDSDWVEVESGFGGLAIYRASLFLDCDYSVEDQDCSGESEHVSLSRKIRAKGGKIYINPAFVNNHWNTYNVNRFFIVRQIRQFFWNLKTK
jgi:hypothetical protein